MLNGTGAGRRWLGLSPRDISQAMKTDVGGALASFIHEARTAGHRIRFSFL